MNRIAASVARMKKQIEARVAGGLTTPAKVEESRAALDLDLLEFARFQELKSLASVDGTLTLEEAQYVFGKLGMTPEHFNRQDAATKAVLSQLFRELLERSMNHV